MLTGNDRGRGSEQVTISKYIKYIVTREEATRRRQPVSRPIYAMKREEHKIIDISEVTVPVECGQQIAL